jgi:precorrin-3B synthase
MTAPTARGWCPTLFTPMEAADGWLARIKPPGATLHADAARVLAQAARDYGDGSVTLTLRGNVQLRGLTSDAVGPVARMMVEAGLADPNPEIERRRAVIFPPLSGAHPVAVAIETALCREDLPHKFCVAVDANPDLPLGETGADITVIYDNMAYAIALAGADKVARVAPDQVGEAVGRLVRVFAESGARRMRTLVAAIGANRIFTAAGLEAKAPPPAREPRNPIGWLADLNVFGIGLPLGRLPAESLAALAVLAELHGVATLRTTPWRALLLPGATDQQAIRAGGKKLGLITDPADRRRLIVACIGTPGCAAACVDVQADAMKLLDLRLAGLVHVSGCAKGCAHPAPAPVTLVGDSGRYNFIRNGSAAAAPLARGLTLRDAVALLERSA